jgi:uncharacterized protein YjiS (DUF1127 family)
MTRHAGTGAAGTIFTLALVGIASRAIRQALRNLKNRVEVRGLHELDDRALKDIGLMRSDVDAALSLPLLIDPSLHLVAVSGRKREPRTEKPAAQVIPAGLDRVRRTDAHLKPLAA